MASYRINQSKRTRGTYLYIERKFWNPEKKNSVSKCVQSFGYLHDLEKEYPNPIAHIQSIVDKLNEEEQTKKITLTIDMDEEIELGTDNTFNLGYAAILKVFHELELDRFFNNKARHERFQFNTNTIMQLLVINRVLDPSSKKKAYESKKNYFERFDFSLDDVYRALPHYSQIKEKCQQFIHEQISTKFGRDTTVVYFDVTNFYFEIDKEDGFRMRGKSKEGRSDPIVQMGLAMDADGIPLCFKTFPGNTHDSKILAPVITDLYVKFNPGRIIVVADMGVTSGDNIFFLKGGEEDKRVNGYIFSYSIPKSSEDFKKYVTDEEGYTDINGDPLREGYEFKIKSRVDVRYIDVNMQNGTKVKKKIDEKQVIFWTKKYDDKAKAERAQIIEKAANIASNPSGYKKKDIKSGVASYLKNITYDKNTGEVIDNPGIYPELNTEKIKAEESLDGYYCIVTSELDMPDSEIIEKYRGLSDIEDNFKISKSDLNIRPVHVSTEDKINAHVLCCFIALVILRLMEKKTGYTPAQIKECLNKIICINEIENTFLFSHRSEMSDAIGQAYDIDFSKRRLSRKDISNLLAKTKK